MSTREKGKIASVSYGRDHDHDVLTFWAMIEFPGSGQGFGGIVLDEKLGPDFRREICRVFEVATVNDLVGLDCYALRCFAINNEPIEGLEAMSGQRFTLNAWRRRHFPETESILVARRRRMLGEIDSLNRRIYEITRDAKTLEERFVTWE